MGFGNGPSPVECRTLRQCLRGWGGGFLLSTDGVRPYISEKAGSLGEQGFVGPPLGTTTLGPAALPVHLRGAASLELPAVGLRAHFLPLQASVSLSVEWG